MTSDPASSPPPPPEPSSELKSARKSNWLARLLSSYGLACIILFFMTLATLLGTLAQKTQGLYIAQHKYFESWFYTHDFVLPGGFPLTLPLPGGLLLMSLLGANLLVGGLIRLRRKPQNIGLFITHSSILVLLAAGLVEHLYKIDGNMAIKEGDTSDTFQSFHDRVIEVEPMNVPKRIAHVVSAPHFDDATPQNPATIRFQDLPVKLTVKSYIRNSGPQSAAPGDLTVDGYTLTERPPEKENEMNLEGAIVELASTTSAETAPALIWGGSVESSVVTVDGKDYAVRIGRRKYKLPFTIKLNDFIREVYPGTDKPKRFSSLVSVTHENGKTEDIDITMNQPLRSEGYAVFQSSFDNRNPREISVFQIAKNPSDHWPLIGFSMVFIGLLIHFLLKLWKFLARPRAARQAAETPVN